MDADWKINNRHKWDRDLARLRLLNLMSSVMIRFEKLLDKESQLFYDEKQWIEKRRKYHIDENIYSKAA